MLEPNRRKLLVGLGATIITAPAIVRAASIMPVKALKPRYLNYFSYQGQTFLYKESPMLAIMDNLPYVVDLNNITLEYHRLADAPAYWIKDDAHGPQT